MRVAQFQMVDEAWKPVAGAADLRPQLVLAFFASGHPCAARALQHLAAAYPDACIAGCTTAGEILGPQVTTDGIIAAAVEFSHGTSVRSTHLPLSDRRNSRDVGQSLGEALRAPDLAGVLLLADGLDTNGTELVSGVRAGIGEGPVVFGGLAGDGLDFIVTRVARGGELAAGIVTALGFYGTQLRISHASASGWTPSGDAGMVTNHVGSILYEIDHRPALDWLCARSGLTARTSLADMLTRPLWVESRSGHSPGVVRSVIGFDKDRGYLVLAGDIPGQMPCRLMQGSAGSLIGGALAAVHGLGSAPPPDSSLALVVSCIGRRLALGDHAPQEALAVCEALGAIPQIGFYAYGEIGRVSGSRNCDFHNQTIAVTVLSEIR